jgi:hypothetical protein
MMGDVMHRFQNKLVELAEEFIVELIQGGRVGALLNIVDCFR